MIKVVSISLENEMDLVLSHKRSMKVAERLGLTLATQTTFATAVSEIARTVIEHTDDGLLEIGLEQNKMRYALIAKVSFDKTIRFSNSDEGFYYAQKLVPEFVLSEDEKVNLITMKIGLPRSLKLDPIKISALKKSFDEDAPINAYEEIKLRNASLNRIAIEQEAELRHSKLIDEKKTEFISIASHELKTPMTILKAYAQMAKATNEPVSAHLLEMLSKIDIQCDKLLNLVQKLLDISKLENGNLQYNMQSVGLNDFLHRQIEVMKHILPDHELITNFGTDVNVMIDETRMEQVLANLLGNAGKYSEKNTDIYIDSSLNDSGSILIRVIDNGLGMSKTTISSIFEKFYRAKEVVKSHAGLGMGLYITSKIITDHQGEIWVESVEGKGSTFCFTIPLTKV